MAKRIIMVHGRHFKPEQQMLTNDWIAALRHGIERDYPQDGREKLDQALISMAYYGDLSNSYLRSKHKNYHAADDVADRTKALNYLKATPSNGFVKNKYELLPGKSAISEALADMFSAPLALLGLGDNAIGVVAPDMSEYWNPESAWGSEVRARLTTPLSEAMNNGDDILLIAHSLGALICYDVLWKFSHYSEYQHLRSAKVSCFLTLGSPLGDENVKSQLKGAAAQGKRRYPHNIKQWFNVAAEDDYIAHDRTVANDFEAMHSFNIINRIADYKIYNLSVRSGKSNPHHSAGYLLAPTVSKIVMDWLNQGNEC